MPYDTENMNIKYINQQNETQPEKREEKSKWDSAKARDIDMRYFSIYVENEKNTKPVINMQ